MTPAPASRAKLLPARLFLFIAPVLYAAYALLVPPFQTFDENQHLYRAWQISSFTFTSQRRGFQSGGELPPGLRDASLREIGSIKPQQSRRVVIRPISKIFSWNTPVGDRQSPIFYDFFGAAVYSPVGYVPQVLAVKLGESAGLSVEWTLRLGRLLNVALCIGLIWRALTILPFGGGVMMTIALLPPAASGAASFGQDGLIIGCGFLLTALGLKTAVEGRWSARTTIIVTAVGVAATLAKLVYLPLVGVAALPKPSGTRPSRWFIPPLIAAAIGVIALAGWMAVNAHSIVPFLPGLPSISDQVEWILMHPFQFSLLVARTLAAFALIAWAKLYTFGDSTVPIVWTAAIAGTAAVLLAMLSGGGEAAALTCGRRLWMLVVFVAVAVLIATALFISFNPPETAGNGGYILGLQARYLLPALPLAGIALMRRQRTNGILVPFTLGLVLVSHVAVLNTIIRTFYSF